MCVVLIVDSILNVISFRFRRLTLRRNRDVGSYGVRHRWLLGWQRWLSSKVRSRRRCVLIHPDFGMHHRCGRRYLHLAIYFSVAFFRWLVSLNVKELISFRFVELKIDFFLLSILIGCGFAWFDLNSELDSPHMHAGVSLVYCLNSINFHRFLSWGNCVWPCPNWIVFDLKYRASR